MMKLLIAVALLATTVYTVEGIKCNDFKDQGFTLHKIEEENKGQKWYYDSTNHPDEQCFVGNLKTEGQSKATFNASKDNEVKLTSTLDIMADGYTWATKVMHKETSTEKKYELRISCYEQGKFFCIHQCSKTDNGADLVHCFITDPKKKDSINAEGEFNKKTGIAYSPGMVVKSAIVPECTY